jgi:DNA-binding NarL/FixJ family response regulator
MTNILVVDDAELLRRGVVSLIQEQAGWNVVGEAATGIDAVTGAEQLQPDIITLDISLPDLNGIEAARLIRKASPNSRIVFLSQHNATQMVEEALGTGALAYVCKSDAGRELLEAIRAALRQESFVSSGCRPSKVGLPAQVGTVICNRGASSGDKTPEAPSTNGIQKKPTSFF